jgi:hypothetical protein
MCTYSMFTLSHVTPRGLQRGDQPAHHLSACFTSKPSVRGGRGEMQASWDNAGDPLFSGIELPSTAAGEEPVGDEGDQSHEHDRP